MSKTRRPIGVLFLCTGNSAGSLLAEAALARRRGERFRSFSCGRQPKATPHPRTIETLARLDAATRSEQIRAIARV